MELVCLLYTSVWCSLVLVCCFHCLLYHLSYPTVPGNILMTAMFLCCCTGQTGTPCELKSEGPWPEEEFKLQQDTPTHLWPWVSSGQSMKTSQDVSHYSTTMTTVQQNHYFKMISLASLLSGLFYIWSADMFREIHGRKILTFFHLMSTPSPTSPKYWWKYCYIFIWPFVRNMK